MQTESKNFLQNFKVNILSQSKKKSNFLNSAPASQRSMLAKMALCSHITPRQLVIELHSLE
jgi:hypothetical protein